MQLCRRLLLCCGQSGAERVVLVAELHILLEQALVFDGKGRLLGGQGGLLGPQAGDGFAAIFPDELHHLFRRRLVGALTGQRGADIVDDNLGTLFCHHQCNVTADPATRASDNHNLACNNTFAHFTFSENTI